MLLQQTQHKTTKQRQGMASYLSKTVVWPSAPSCLPWSSTGAVQTKGHVQVFHLKTSSETHEVLCQYSSHKHRKKTNGLNKEPNQVCIFLAQVPQQPNVWRQIRNQLQINISTSIHGTSTALPLHYLKAYFNQQYSLFAPTGTSVTPILHVQHLFGHLCAIFMTGIFKLPRLCTLQARY